MSAILLAAMSVALGLITGCASIDCDYVAVALVQAPQDSQKRPRESVLEVVGSSLRSLGYVVPAKQDVHGEVGGFSIGDGETTGNRVDVHIDNGEITVHDLKHRGSYQTRFVLDTQRAIQAAVETAYGARLVFKQPNRRTFDCLIRP